MNPRGCFNFTEGCFVKMKQPFVAAKQPFILAEHRMQKIKRYISEIE
jgi:hypothetical protein